MTVRDVRMKRRRIILCLAVLLAAPLTGAAQEWTSRGPVGSGGSFIGAIVVVALSAYGLITSALFREVILIYVTMILGATMALYSVVAALTDPDSLLHFPIIGEIEPWGAAVLFGVVALFGYRRARSGLEEKDR